MSDFSIVQRVRFGDLDAMQHMNNVEFLRYFETARIEFIRTIFPGRTPTSREDFTWAKRVTDLFEKGLARKKLVCKPKRTLANKLKQRRGGRPRKKGVSGPKQRHVVVERMRDEQFREAHTYSVYNMGGPRQGGARGRRSCRL